MKVGIFPIINKILELLNYNKNIKKKKKFTFNQILKLLNKNYFYIF